LRKDRSNKCQSKHLTLLLSVIHDNDVFHIN
jgi:hypothetical protein